MHTCTHMRAHVCMHTHVPVCAHDLCSYLLFRTGGCQRRCCFQQNRRGTAVIGKLIVQTCYYQSVICQQIFEFSQSFQKYSVPFYFRLILAKNVLPPTFCFAWFRVTLDTGSSSTVRKFNAAEKCFSPGRPTFEWAENLSTYSIQ